MKYLSTIISQLDYEIILKVKVLREKCELSQRDLSEKMNLSKSFVGKVEALGQPDKYSIRHLNLIAKALMLKSVAQLIPRGIQSHDMVEIIYEKVPKLNKDGSESRQFEEKIIQIAPITKT
ncbi:helix-turn-helix domain-containing protein [Pedobacter agri]|uniref:Helix-turn-helix transcriptional regulator n=1 Tax=Pedobacter agri TaxID=454586 RepID=A0A9X3DA49_9SPHI|nr:helix-turn-helix transcriptional regulator [Pedobacter agri]MCX3263702.1 helix-turn-helix transcriptional regulator [Pedobacter agri]